MDTVRPIMIETLGELKRIVGHLSGAKQLAVDTESDSFFSYRGKLCLIQISDRRRDYVIDPLAVKDLSPLEELFANPKTQKVLHAAEQDIREIKAACDMKFENVFDTMVAARILGWKSCGLASLLEVQFGVKLDKRFQRSNWGARPLSQEQLVYAACDTHYLLELRDLLDRELTLNGLREEAQDEFDRFARAVPQRRSWDGEAWRWYKGAKELNDKGLAVLRELYLFRERTAKKLDRPSFKIFPESLLVKLAYEIPLNMEELRRTQGVTPYIMKRFGRLLLRAIADGHDGPPVPPPEHKPTRRKTHLTRAEQKRYEKLREWRRERAKERDVEPDVIIGNESLKEISRRFPESVEALAEIDGLGPARIKKYGDSLLGVLRGADGK